MTDIPNFTQAEVIAPLYEEMKAELGEERAADILARAVQKSARAEAAAHAAAEPGGTSLRSFIALYDRLYKGWGPGCGLDVTVLRADDEALDFDVTRCGYLELYREMGLGHLAPVLSCNRDGTFAEGYDPAISLTREQTLAEGAPCCTFRYRYRRAAAAGADDEAGAPDAGPDPDG